MCTRTISFVKQQRTSRSHKLSGSFETTASREAAKTKTLIADLDRIVQIISIEITTQEEEAGGFDRFQDRYPMRARELTERRDKLTDTIAVLERYLRLK